MCTHLGCRQAAGSAGLVACQTREHFWFSRVYLPTSGFCNLEQTLDAIFWRHLSQYLAAVACPDE